MTAEDHRKQLAAGALVVVLDLTQRPEKIRFCSLHYPSQQM